MEVDASTTILLAGLLHAYVGAQIPLKLLRWSSWFHSWKPFYILGVLLNLKTQNRGVYVCTIENHHSSVHLITASVKKNLQCTFLQVARKICFNLLSLSHLIQQRVFKKQSKTPPSSVFPSKTNTSGELWSSPRWRLALGTGDSRGQQGGLQGARQRR